MKQKSIKEKKVSQVISTSKFDQDHYKRLEY